MGEDVSIRAKWRYETRENYTFRLDPKRTMLSLFLLGRHSYIQGSIGVIRKPCLAYKRIRYNG